MNRFYRQLSSFVGLCFVFSAVSAQITITQADLPSANDTLRVSYTTDTVDIVSTGANYTWDFSYLKATSQWVEKFDHPSTFTFPFNLVFNQFNTTYGQKQYTPDSVPGLGIQMGDAYGFFKKSSSDLRQTGYGMTLNSIPVPFSYNPVDYIYRFPVAMGNIDSCDAKFGPSISLGYYYGQNIHRKNEVDGWGTLITPFGTFQSLRIKTTLAIRDTFADSSGVGFAFPRPLQYEFKWLVTGGKVPYMQINASDVAGIPVVTNIAYRDSVRAGTTQIGVGELNVLNGGLSLFPNPTRNYAVLQYELLSSVSDLRLELTDVQGRNIYSEQLSGGLGINTNAIDISGYKPGVYFVRLISGLQMVGVTKLLVK